MQYKFWPIILKYSWGYGFYFLKSILSFSSSYYLPIVAVSIAWYTVAFTALILSEKNILSFFSLFPCYFLFLSFFHLLLYSFPPFPWFFLLFIFIMSSIACCFLSLLFSLTFTLKERYIEMFAPMKALQWWIEGILAGKLWRAYKILLAAPTAWCYSHRKTLFIGEVSF